MSYNRISYGRTPNNIPFINQNLNVLNKFTQIDGFIYFNGQKLGKPLTVSQYNNQSNGSNSSSSYNISFSDIQNIVFEGAVVKQNPYNKKQIRVVVDSLGDYLQQVDQKLTITYDYYKIKQVNSTYYNIDVKQYIICNGKQSAVIKLPSSPNDMDYVKIATLGRINSQNTVTIAVKTVNMYINSTNQTTLVIDTPYSSLQLVYSSSTNTWLVLTPFVPMQRNTSGLTNQEAVKMAKKQMLIFG